MVPVLIPTFPFASIINGVVSFAVLSTLTISVPEVDLMYSEVSLSATISTFADGE